LLYIQEGQEYFEDEPFNTTFTRSDPIWSWNHFGKYWMKSLSLAQRFFGRRRYRNRNFVERIIRYKHLIYAGICEFTIFSTWTSLTKRIFWKSLISISVLAVFIHFENFSTLTEDKLIIAIFGGLFLVAGIGLTIKNDALLDGSEILGIYLNNRFGFSIGTIILIFNTLLFSATAILLSLEIAMYSVLTSFLIAKVIDLTIEGFED